MSAVTAMACFRPTRLRRRLAPSTFSTHRCRVDQMTRIKDSGQAGVIAYAITEAGFWVGSVPFALGAAYVATGEIPDWRAAASLASPRLAVYL